MLRLVKSVSSQSQQLSAPILIRWMPVDPRRREMLSPLTSLSTLFRFLLSSPINIFIIKSNKDIRYGLDSIVMHDGEKLPCLPLADLSSIREKLGAEVYDKLDVIGIDEAQSFGDLYDFCYKAADHDGKTVIVAGLDGDYMRLH
ncbi:hypothetical protein ACS0TY_030080 [Phlomoides rotata]